MIMTVWTLRDHSSWINVPRETPQEGGKMLTQSLSLCDHQGALSHRVAWPCEEAKARVSVYPSVTIADWEHW